MFNVRVDGLAQRGPEGRRTAWGTAIAAIALVSTVAQGQRCGPDDQKYNEPTCGGTLTYCGRVVDFREYHIGPITGTLNKGLWISNGARSCNWLPCDQRPGLRDMEQRWSHMHKTCWSVSGGASVVGKTALLASLFGQLQVTVNIKGEFQNCDEETQGTTWYISQDYCFDQLGRELIQTQTIKGEVEEYPALFFWNCDAGGGSITQMRVKCGVCVKSDATASKFARSTQFAPHEQPCGGAISNPDWAEGARSARCCHPMLGCEDDVIPPAGHSCCGCYSPE